MGKDIQKLENTKEEVVKMECSLLLNELICSIVLNDYQSKVEEMDNYESSEIITESELCSSLYDIEKIDEVSNESSFEDQYDSGSIEYKQKKDTILMNCIEITKENKDISNKLDEIIASLSPSIEFLYK